MCMGLYLEEIVYIYTYTYTDISTHLYRFLQPSTFILASLGNVTSITVMDSYFIISKFLKAFLAKKNSENVLIVFEITSRNNNN